MFISRISIISDPENYSRLLYNKISRERLPRLASHRPPLPPPVIFGQDHGARSLDSGGAFVFAVAVASTNESPVVGTMPFPSRCARAHSWNNSPLSIPPPDRLTGKRTNVNKTREIDDKKQPA